MLLRRGLQDDLAALDRVRCRVVGMVRTAVQFIPDRICRGAPFSREGLCAGAAAGDRIAFGPLYEVVVLLRRIRQRDAVLDRVGRRVRSSVRAAVKHIGDRIIDQAPACGKGLRTGAARRDHAVVRPALEVVAGTRGRRQRDSILDRVPGGVGGGVRSAELVIDVQVVDNVIFDRGPVGGKGLIAGRMQRDLAVVGRPSVERVARSGGFRKRDRLFIGIGFGVGGVVRRLVRAVGIAQVIGDVVIDDLPLGSEGLVAGAVCGDRIALGPPHEGVARAARILKRDRRIGDLIGIRVRGVVRAAAQHVGDIVGHDIPVGGKGLVAGAAFFDHTVIGRPASERVTGLFRICQCNGVFDRVGRRV